MNESIEEMMASGAVVPDRPGSKRLVPDAQSAEPTDAQIDRAIKVTEYKYFGDYDMSPEQFVAVDTLVAAAAELIRLREAAPAPSSLAGGEWRSPTEVPETKWGEHAYRIVAVKRADGEKVVTFSAFYMNDVSLWFEDDNEARTVTGWHSDSEGDDGPTYSPLLTEGDVLMGWREFPQWEAALSPETPARVGVDYEIDRSDALTPRQMDALHDAFNRVLAGDFDGEIPIEVYDRAYDKIVKMGRRIAALTPRHEAPAEGAEETMRNAVELLMGVYRASCVYEENDGNPDQEHRLAALRKSIQAVDTSAYGIANLGPWPWMFVDAALRARSSAPEARS